MLDDGSAVRLTRWCAESVDDGCRVRSVDEQTVATEDVPMHRSVRDDRHDAVRQVLDNLESALVIGVVRSILEGEAEVGVGESSSLGLR